MAGLLVAINGKPLASVSNSGLNIISVHVHGDVIGEEVAALEIYGGLYGQGEADKHLIWVENQEIAQDDELEIAFVEDVSTSHPGKTIEELHPETASQEASDQSMDELYKELSERPRVRENFSFELVSPDGDEVSTSTESDDYSFQLGVMWRWHKPDVARVSLKSNTLEKIVNREDGSSHAAFNLQFGQKFTFRIVN